MSLELQRQLTPASFKNNDRTTKQVDMIVDLLQTSIKEQRQITLDDIIKTYVNWREKNGREFYKEVFNHGWKEKGEHYYKYPRITRKEFSELPETKMTARNWFKNNLGSAIIRGKVLAIPVINIDDTSPPSQTTPAKGD